MILTLQQKFDIILSATEALGSYETCDCGCPSGVKARIGDPIHAWAIAHDALEKIGEQPKVFEYDETSCTYRQSPQ